MRFVCPRRVAIAGKYVISVCELREVCEHGMVIVGADGKATEWGFEMGSVGQLVRGGWKQDTVKPGDKLTMTMHPLKDGSRGGQYVSALTADGHRYNEIVPGGNAPPDGNVLK